MKKCKQIIEGAESQCGKDICCEYCESKCKNKCDKTPETCGFLCDTEETSDGVLTNPKVDQFVTEYDKTLMQIKNFELEAMKIEDQSKILREKLMKAMEEYNIKVFENDYIKLTYVQPTKRETIDSKRLKSELPDVAKQFTKVSDVKASIKIMVK